MCKIIEDLINEERKDATRDANVETALRMIKEGSFANEQIAKISNLHLDEVEKLIKGHTATAT